MTALYSRPEQTTMTIGGNDPVYNERGQRLVLKDCQRRPSRPFAAPICHKQRARRIGWNTYRCRSCAARIQPERLYHRLMLGRNPFRPDGTVRDLFRVTRWAKA